MGYLHAKYHIVPVMEALRRILNPAGHGDRISNRLIMTAGRSALQQHHAEPRQYTESLLILVQATGDGSQPYLQKSEARRISAICAAERLLSLEACRPGC